jgi:hypothetical protein
MSTRSTTDNPAQVEAAAPLDAYLQRADAAARVAQLVLAASEPPIS